MTYGQNGWYWVMNSGHYAVVVTNHKVLNKYFNSDPDYSYPAGSEDVFYLTPEEFTEYRVARKLKVDPSRQAELRKQHDLKYADNAILASAAGRNH